MSKTYNKVVNAIHALLQAVPVTAESFQLDVAAFRSANKLGSEPKALLVKHIKEALIRDDANKGDDGLGAWVMGEVRHPVYQFSRLNVVSEIRYVENRPHFVTVGGSVNDDEGEVPRTVDTVAIEALVQARTDAKRDGNEKVVTSMTEHLNSMGVKLTDSEDGTTWTVDNGAFAYGGKVDASVYTIHRVSEVDTMLRVYHEHLMDGEGDEAKKIERCLTDNDILFSIGNSEDSDWCTNRTDLIDGPAEEPKSWTWSPTLAKELKSAFSKAEIAALLKHGLLNEAGEMAAPTIKQLRILLKEAVKVQKQAPKAKKASIKKVTKPVPKAKKTAPAPKRSKAAPKAKKDLKKLTGKPVNQQPVDSSIPPGASVAQHYGIGN